MADIGIVESGLTFETRQSPRSTHESWVMRHLENMTMASEMKIKSETMGFDTKKLLAGNIALLLQTAVTREASVSGERISELGGVFETAKQFYQMTKLPTSNEYLLHPLAMLKTIWQANPQVSELYVRFLAAAAYYHGGKIAARMAQPIFEKPIRDIPNTKIEQAIKKMTIPKSYNRK